MMGDLSNEFLDQRRRQLIEINCLQRRTKAIEDIRDDIREALRQGRLSQSQIAAISQILNE